MNKPIIAITMGDPASIGPEIGIKALLKKEIYDICKPILVGDAGVFKNIIQILNLNASVNVISDVKDALFELGKPDVLDLNNVERKDDAILSSSLLVIS
jgi:4-hydroxythreonine-4-phosphate dehydrogenase